MVWYNVVAPGMELGWLRIADPLHEPPVFVGVFKNVRAVITGLSGDKKKKQPSVGPGPACDQRLCKN